MYNVKIYTYTPLFGVVNPDAYKLMITDTEWLKRTWNNKYRLAQLYSRNTHQN